MRNDSLVVGIENRDGMLVVSSRRIADELNKRHADVIKQLENILTDEQIRSLIIASNYKDKKGEMRKEYLLTKDGFTLYMFNIQGHNDFKIRYINKFNEMENFIRNQVPQITHEQQLVLSIYNGGVEAIESTKQLIALKTKDLEDIIEKNQPKVETYDIVFEEKYYDARKLASMLNMKDMGRNNLLSYLRSVGILGKNNTPYRKYIEQGLCKQIPTSMTDINGNIIMKTVFSDKMLNKLIKMLDRLN